MELSKSQLDRLSRLRELRESEVIDEEEYRRQAANVREGGAEGEGSDLSHVNLRRPTVKLAGSRKAVWGSGANEELTEPTGSLFERSTMGSEREHSPWFLCFLRWIFRGFRAVPIAAAAAACSLVLVLTIGVASFRFPDQEVKAAARVIPMRSKVQRGLMMRKTAVSEHNPHVAPLFGRQAVESCFDWCSESNLVEKNVCVRGCRKFDTKYYARRVLMVDPDPVADAKQIVEECSSRDITRTRQRAERSWKNETSDLVRSYYRAARQGIRGPEWSGRELNRINQTVSRPPANAVWGDPIARLLVQGSCLRIHLALAESFLSGPRADSYSADYYRRLVSELEPKVTGIDIPLFAYAQSDLGIHFPRAKSFAKQEASLEEQPKLALSLPFIRYDGREWVRAHPGEDLAELDTCRVLGRRFSCLAQEKAEFGVKLSKLEAELLSGFR